MGTDYGDETYVSPDVQQAMDGEKVVYDRDLVDTSSQSQPEQAETVEEIDDEVLSLAGDGIGEE